MADIVGEFRCVSCGAEFAVPEQVLARYSGWKPKLCRNCRDKGKATPSRRTVQPTTRNAKTGMSRERNCTLDEVLARFHDGPVDGVFTDGAAEPNPGPGGWGAVYVQHNTVVERAYGHEPATTNNRMELTALIRGCALVPPQQTAILYTDSRLCVQSINEWAKGWEQRGWKRKGGAIKNLDLVQELYAIVKARPELSLQWIAAHSGFRWNEYADALATAYRRDKL